MGPGILNQGSYIAPNYVMEGCCCEEPVLRWSKLQTSRAVFSLSARTEGGSMRHWPNSSSTFADFLRFKDYKVLRSCLLYRGFGSRVSDVAFSITVFDATPSAATRRGSLRDGREPCKAYAGAMVPQHLCSPLLASRRP